MQQPVHNDTQKNHKNNTNEFAPNKLVLASGFFRLVCGDCVLRALRARVIKLSDTHAQFDPFPAKYYYRMAIWYIYLCLNLSHILLFLLLSPHSLFAFFKHTQNNVQTKRTLLKFVQVKGIFEVGTFSCPNPTPSLFSLHNKHNFHHSSTHSNATYITINSHPLTKSVCFYTYFHIHPNTAHSGNSLLLSLSQPPFLCVRFFASQSRDLSPNAIISNCIILLRQKQNKNKSACVEKTKIPHLLSIPLCWHTSRV